MFNYLVLVKMKTNWIERRPKENETVRVDFADFTGLGTKIGICLGYNDRCKILFGDCIRFLDSNSQFFVYEK